MTEPNAVPETPRELSDALDNRYDELLDLNTLMQQKMRQTARNLIEIQMMHLRQAERVGELAELTALGAKMVSDMTGDIIVTEFDIDTLVAQEYGVEFEDDESDDEEDSDGDDSE